MRRHIHIFKCCTSLIPCSRPPALKFRSPWRTGARSANALLHGIFAHWFVLYFRLTIHNSLNSIAPIVMQIEEGLAELAQGGAAVTDAGQAILMQVREDMSSIRRWR